MASPAVRVASVSGNGRIVAFTSCAPGLVDGPTGHGDVYVHDVKTATTTLASPGLGGVASDVHDVPGARTPISGDGRYVGFISSATNLVTGDINGVADGFVRDLKKGVTRPRHDRHRRRGGQRPVRLRGLGLDHDGDTAAFISSATNLVPGDTNGQQDVFVARLKK